MDDYTWVLKEEIKVWKSEPKKVDINIYDWKKEEDNMKIVEYWVKEFEKIRRSPIDKAKDMLNEIIGV